MLRSLLLLLMASLVGGCGAGAGLRPQPWGAGGRPSLKVGTWNLYYGADLDGIVLAVLGGEPEQVVLAATEAFAQVQATDFAQRAEVIAAEIVARDLDLVGLQEAALWRTQSPADSLGDAPTPAQDVAFDFVATLVEALARHGATFEVAALLETFDAELPGLDGAGELMDIRLTDREAILVRRRDLREGPGVAIESSAGDWYGAYLELPGGLAIPQGWVAVDANYRGRSFRFVSTHLEADFPDIRLAQIAELLAGPAAGPRPTILVGDFNADALSDTPVSPNGYELLLAGGFEDAAAGAPAVASAGTATRSSSLDDPLDVLYERIDLILLRNDVLWNVSETGLMGALPADFVGGLWPSDHAGVAAAVLTGRP